ncbi:unnamed protein product [Lactuca virosa]|uniref:Uncharacterized protein n=1 Tax=Lactuca virosa TaxID=75947 RepID=A0AAU9N3U3_9ASTR|nr:unnamed protein product [Lactuca virosa]
MLFLGRVQEERIESFLWFEANHKFKPKAKQMLLITIIYLQLLQADDQKYQNIVIDQSSLQAMASGAGQPATFFLFFINLVLFLIITIIASWAVNHGIDDTHQQASVLSIPARIFPIYYPFGNMATGYVVVLSLLAGVLGLVTSLTGIYNVAQWNASNLYAASASSLLSWTLTLLAMGFACKEIEIGWTGNTLRVLETILIVVTGTQLFGMIAIHAGIEEVSRYGGGGRV